MGSCTGQASTTLTVTASAPAAPEVVVAATATGIGSVAPMGAPFQSTTPVASVSAFAPTVHLWRDPRPVTAAVWAPAPVEGGYIASAPALEPDAGELDAGERTGEPTGDDDAAPFAPSVTVLVDLNGTGAGTITGSVSCAGLQTSCPVATTAGAMLTFTAAPQAGMTFTGWTGACTGLSTTCAVTASDGLLVVANFRATFTAVTSYYHLDALGSVRAITDAAGAVVERHDFRPFGADTEPLPDSGTDARRFAGEERDGTGLDYFGARYFSLATGRFTSVDPIVSPAALVDPQKWNRYAYARNNPLRFVDPTGMDDEESRPPLEMYEGGCSAICQEFDSWANEWSFVWRVEYLEQTGGLGGDDDQKPTVTTSTTITLPDGRVVGDTHPLDQLLQDVAKRTNGVETLVRLFIMGFGTIVAPQATAAATCLAEESCDGAAALAMIPGGRLLGANNAIRIGKTGNQISHAFRHIEAAGLDRARVTSAIVDDLSGLVGDLPKGLTKRSIVVDGVTLDYHAFKLPGGTINVGRITPRKPRR